MQGMEREDGVIQIEIRRASPMQWARKFGYELAQEGEDNGRSKPSQQDGV